MSFKGEQPRDGDKFSLCHVYNWFTDLSNLIRATGVVAEKAGGEVEPLFQTTVKGISYYVSGMGILRFRETDLNISVLQACLRLG